MRKLLEDHENYEALLVEVLGWREPKESKYKRSDNKATGVAIMTREYPKVNNEVKARKSAARSLSAQVKELIQESTAADAKVKQLMGKSTTAEAKVKQLSSDLCDAKQELDLLKFVQSSSEDDEEEQPPAASLRTALEEEKKDNNELKTKFFCQNTTIDSLKSEISNLKGAATARSRTIGNYKRDVINKGKAIVNLKTERERLGNQIDGFELGMTKVEQSLELDGPEIIRICEEKDLIQKEHAAQAKIIQRLEMQVHELHEDAKARDRGDNHLAADHESYESAAATLSQSEVLAENTGTHTVAVTEKAFHSNRDLIATSKKLFKRLKIASEEVTKLKLNSDTLTQSLANCNELLRTKEDALQSQSAQLSEQRQLACQWEYFALGIKQKLARLQHEDERGRQQQDNEPVKGLAETEVTAQSNGNLAAQVLSTDRNEGFQGILLGLENVSRGSEDG